MHPPLRLRLAPAFRALRPAAASRASFPEDRTAGPPRDRDEGAEEVFDGKAEDTVGQEPFRRPLQARGHVERQPGDAVLQSHPPTLPTLPPPRPSASPRSTRRRRSRKGGRRRKRSGSPGILREAGSEPQQPTEGDDGVEVAVCGGGRRQPSVIDESRSRGNALGALDRPDFPIDLLDDFPIENAHLF